jgi:hypothetical protein
LSIVSIIVSLCMIYPSARYCIQISSNNDYDFTNMFLQSMIFKLFLFSVFLIVLNICKLFSKFSFFWVNLSQ